jgi:hypothetical protein
MTDLAVATTPTADASTLQRHAPLRKFWFDETPPRTGVAVR